MDSVADKRLREGLIYALSAYVLWGLSPLYWVWFESSPLEIIAHRGVWAAVALAPYVWFRRQELISVFRSWKRLGAAALAAFLIGSNWFLFIWAVMNGAIMEASLGYFIGPLISVALGIVFLKERLRRGQSVAIALAAIGVSIPVIAAGTLPWISLYLAVSFALYAYVRKRAEVDGATGLFLETLLLMPVALAIIVWFEINGTGRFTEWSFQPVLLIISGVVLTAGILLLFILGAKRLRLSTLGLIQFLAPSMQFVIGVTQGEPFPLWRALSFAIIWLGVTVFIIDTIRADRALRKIKAA